jgi:hypothetical protein
MVRRSVPYSSRWQAKACLKECGVTGLERPLRSAPNWQASATPDRVTYEPGITPGNNHGVGLAARYQSRRITKR